jgi:hypothetical protein
LGGCALSRELGYFADSGAAKDDVLCLSLTGGTEAVDLGDGALELRSYVEKANKNGPFRVILDGGGRRVRKTASEGLLLEVGNNMELTLRNIALEGSPGNSGCLVKVTGGGRLILETGVSIQGNGAGVQVESGMLIMRDGAISGMESGYGAHIAVDGVFIMEGGDINGNAASGVHIDGGSFTLNGGTIRGNRTAGDGGGVHVDSGSFTMNGGIIGGNTASGNGGGVRVIGVFVMNGGIISGNAAAGDGGGVYVASGGVFIKKEGIVFGPDEAGDAPRTNSATRGNAAFVYESATRFKKREATAGMTDTVAFKGVSHADNKGWEEE